MSIDNLKLRTKTLLPLAMMCLTVLAMVAFTIFANITGLPAISLPVHWTDEGLPVGAQLVGSPFCEAQLIRLAHVLEQALPWADRRPALAAA